MEQQDKKTKCKRGIAKMPVCRAPQGNVKGIGPLGIYTGGLTPLVVAPKPGLSPRRVAPTIFRGYNSDSVNPTRITRRSK
jgi:hypothetical protein